MIFADTRNSRRRQRATQYHLKYSTINITLCIVFLCIVLNYVILFLHRMRDDLHLNWETSEGHPFPYFTYGAAVSEVEIDCLTGAHQVC